MSNFIDKIIVVTESKTELQRELLQNKNRVQELIHEMSEKGELVNTLKEKVKSMQEESYSFQKNVNTQLQLETFVNEGEENSEVRIHIQPFFYSACFVFHPSKTCNVFLL